MCLFICELFQCFHLTNPTSDHSLVCLLSLPGSNFNFVIIIIIICVFFIVVERVLQRRRRRRQLQLEKHSLRVNGFFCLKSAGKNLRIR